MTPNAARNPKGDPRHGGPLGSLRIIVWTGLVLFLVPLLLVVALNLPAVQNLVIARVAAEAGERLGVAVTMKSYRWWPFSALSVTGLDVKAADAEFLRCETVEVAYRLMARRPYVTVTGVLLRKPSLRLEKTADGAWRIPGPETPEGGAGGSGLSGLSGIPLPPVRIESGTVVAVQGGQTVLELRDVTGTLAAQVVDGPKGPKLRLDLGPLGGRVSVPEVGPVKVSGVGFVTEAEAVIESLSLDLPQGGRVALTGTVSLVPPLSGSFTATLSPLHWGAIPLLARLAPPPETVSGEIRGEVAPGGLVTLSHTLRSNLGSITGTAEGSLSGEGGYTWTGDLKDARVAAVSGLSGLSGHFSAAVSGSDARTLSGRLSLDLAPLSWGKETLDRATLSASLAGGVLTVSSCALDTSLGKAALSGTATLKDLSASLSDAFRHGIATDLRYTLSDIDLGRVTALLPGEVKAGGKVHSSGSVRGTWPDLHWDGEVRGKDLHYGAYRVAEARLKGKGPLGGLDGRRTALVEARGLDLDGRRAASARCELDQDGGLVKFSLKGEKVLDAGSLSLAGEVERPWELPFTLSLSQGRVDWRGEAFSGSGRFTVREGGLQVHALRVEQGGQRLSAQGETAFPGRSDFSLAFENITVEKWLKLAGLEPSVKGVASGTARLSGTLDHPEVSMKGGLARAVVYGETLEKLTVEASYKGEVFRFSGEARSEAAASPAKVSGEVAVHVSLQPPAFALQREKPVRVSLEVKGLKASQVLTRVPDVVSAGGEVQVTAEVRGTLARPEIRGEGGWKDGTLRLSSVPGEISGIQLAYTIDPRELRIREGSMKLLKGEATLGGTVGIERGEIGAVNILINVKDIAPPKIYGIQGKTSGDARLSRAGPNASPEITGDFQFSRAFMDLGDFELALAQSIQVVGEEAKGDVIVVGGDQTNPLVRDLALDLKLHLPKKGGRVRGMGLDVAVAGLMEVKKASGEPVRLYGRLATTRGTYTFQGVRLQVTEGEMVFTGAPQPDPLLRVVAGKDVGSVAVRAEVTGFLANPRLLLSSTPPRDQVELMSYLLFGKSPDRLTGKESAGLQEQGAAFFGSAASKLLKDVIRQTPFAPLDKVNIDSRGDVVEISTNLSPDLSVTYEKGLSTDTSDNVRMEYRLNRNFSIQSNVASGSGTSNQSGADLFWRYDFGE